MLDFERFRQRFGSPSSARLPGNQSPLSITRRTLLKGIASTPILVGTPLAAFHGDGVSFHWNGVVLFAIQSNQCIWSIDPSIFSTGSRLRVDVGPSKITAVLTNAFFKGTLIPADFQFE